MVAALISLGVITGTLWASAPDRGTDGSASTEGPVQGGWLESGWLAGGIALLLALVYGQGEWRRRRALRQWAAKVAEEESALLRSEEQWKAKAEECRQVSAARERERQDGERCRAELAEEKKRREEETREVLKLKPLGALAGGIAHDFNNILTIVIGNVSLAKMAACTWEDRQRWLEQAERAALRAKALTQQLLALSKEGLLLKKRACLRELMEDAVRLAAPGQNIRLEYSWAADIWPVEVDAGQVIQALESLVMQADRNMPEGGVMLFVAANESLAERNPSALAAGDYVHLSIQSLGGDALPERLVQMFNPSGGLLAGDFDYPLMAAHGIIKRHGGSIRFEPLPDKGGVFHVYVPANRTVDFTEVPSPVPAEGLAGRILVMDDEEGIRQVAMVMLKQLGYETVVARDGLEALASYRAAQRQQHPFDLVILDLTVPGGLGGKEAVQRLRQIDAQAKVVVSSGYLNDPVMAHFRQYGFDGVIAKPYKMEELATVVVSVVKSRARPAERLLPSEVGSG